MFILSFLFLNSSFLFLVQNMIFVFSIYHKGIDGIECQYISMQIIIICCSATTKALCLFSVFVFSIRIIVFYVCFLLLRFFPRPYKRFVFRLFFLHMKCSAITFIIVIVKFYGILFPLFKKSLRIPKG